MINLCLVVIATQFSETKKREMEKMLVERRRSRQQHSSCSTLASSSDLQPGDCYEEMLKFVEHLVRKSRRHLRRFVRRRQRAAAAAKQPQGTDADADATVIVCRRASPETQTFRVTAGETQPLRVTACEADNAQENDENRRPSCLSSSSSFARRPSSLQIDSSSSSGSLRNSPAFASVVSLASRSSSLVPPVDTRKYSLLSQHAVTDTPPTQPPIGDSAPVQYLVLPLQVVGDPQRRSSSTPNPSPAVGHVVSPASGSTTSHRGSVQFVDSVKTCVHRTASAGNPGAPLQCDQSPLVRKASVLSSGANVEDHRPTSSLIKSASFNSARCSREKCFRFSPETEANRRDVDSETRRDSGDVTDVQRRRTSGPSSSTSSVFGPSSPNFLEVPTQADLPAGPSPCRQVSPVCRAASFSEVEARQQRTHRPCVTSLSVPSSTPVTTAPHSPLLATTTAQPRRRSFRVNDSRTAAVRHRAVRRAVSCRAATRRARKSSATVGRAASLNEGARGRRVAAAQAAERAASISSLGLFGSDFLFCSQTGLSSTADIYRRMQQRARLNAALSNDSGMYLSVPTTLVLAAVNCSCSFSWLNNYLTAVVAEQSLLT